MHKLLIALLLMATPALAEDIGNNTVCFVPGPDDCAMVAAAEIGKATKTVDMQAYQYTEPHIAGAVLAARAQGVTVQLIVDKTAVNEVNGEPQPMVSAGIPVGR